MCNSCLSSQHGVSHTLDGQTPSTHCRIQEDEANSFPIAYASSVVATIFPSDLDDKSDPTLMQIAASEGLRVSISTTTGLHGGRQTAILSFLRGLSGKTGFCSPILRSLVLN
ncbi:unnamed protein product [Phytophthora fragariaefolia]|uniref:Unnamed protein product n=1 Tax=Phytophthora fragariaefolia TaxID=1490495 RepID=A0A9W6U323_9STRA|nr:unnamed protein product [Phytophthora fragariaefolia]